MTTWKKLIVGLVLAGVFAVSQGPPVYRLAVWDPSARRWIYPVLDQGVFVLAGQGTSDPNGTISVRLPASSRVYNVVLVANPDYTYTLPSATPRNVVVYVNDWHMAPAEYTLLGNVIVPKWNWPLGSAPTVVVEYDP